MFLHGIEDFSIVRGDTLRNPAFFEADGLKTFDCVIAKPSISLKEWEPKIGRMIRTEEILQEFHQQGNGDMAWVQHMIKSMNASGPYEFTPWCFIQKGAEGRIH